LGFVGGGDGGIAAFPHPKFSPGKRMTTYELQPTIKSVSDGTLKKP
jgi:hypothetical protein